MFQGKKIKLKKQKLVCGIIHLIILSFKLK